MGHTTDTQHSTNGQPENQSAAEPLPSAQTFEEMKRLRLEQMKQAQKESRNLQISLEDRTERFEQREVADVFFDKVTGKTSIETETQELYRSRITELTKSISALQQGLDRAESCSRKGDSAGALNALRNLPASLSDNTFAKKKQELEEQRDQSLERDTTILGYTQGTRGAAVVGVGVLSAPIWAGYGLGAAGVAAGVAVTGWGYAALTNLASATSDTVVNGTPVNEAISRASSQQMQDYVQVGSVAVGSQVGITAANAPAVSNLVSKVPAVMNTLRGAVAGTVSGATISTLLTTEQLLEHTNSFMDQYGGLNLTLDARVKLFGQYLEGQGVTASSTLTNIMKQSLLGTAGGAIGGSLSNVYYGLAASGNSTILTRSGEAVVNTALALQMGDSSPETLASLGLSALIGVGANNPALLRTTPRPFRPSQTTKPMVATLKAEDFADPEDYHALMTQRKAMDADVKPSVARDFDLDNPRHPVTGLFGPEGRVFTLERALEFSKATGIPSTYLEADITNLGATNLYLGRSGANHVMREIAQDGLVQGLKQALPNAKVIPFHHGGDELGFVIVGADEATVRQALPGLTKRVDNIVSSQKAPNGAPLDLQHLEHSKAQGNPEKAGVSTVFGLSAIKGQDFRHILEKAEQEVETSKLSRRNTSTTRNNLVTLPESIVPRSPMPPSNLEIVQSVRETNSYVSQLPEAARSSSTYLTQQQIRKIALEDLSSKHNLSEGQKKILFEEIPPDQATGTMPQHYRTSALNYALHIAKSGSQPLNHSIIEIRNIAALNENFGASGANHHFRKLTKQYETIMREAGASTVDVYKGRGPRFEAIVAGLTPTQLARANNTYRNWLDNYSKEQGLSDLTYKKDPSNGNMKGLGVYIGSSTIDDSSNTAIIYYRNDLQIFRQEQALKGEHSDATRR